MDRALSDAIKQKRKRGIILKITFSLIIVIIILLSLQYFIQPSIQKEDFYTAVTETGNVQASVSASGTVLPEFEEIKTSPIQSTIKRIHHNTGDNVESSDSILSLDTKNTILTLEKLKDQLALRENSVNQLKLQLEKSLIDLKTQYQIKKLRVESMAADLKEAKYLNKIGGGTKEKIEKADLNLNIAKLELNQIKATIANKEKSMKVDMKGLNYEINIQKKNVRELSEKLDEATITADKEGVITWIYNQIGQTVNIGQELVKIANLHSYKVEGTISDRHAAKLRNGGKIIIRINNDADINGEIVSISPSVQNHIIEFQAKLDTKNHPLLRPNLKVDVFVQTVLKENAIRVKNGAFYRGGAKQKVFAVKDNMLIRRDVEFGHSNFDYVEIVKGLAEGEKIVTSDMSDYENRDKIKIK